MSPPVPYKNQNYAELKEACKAAKTLFEDPEFPATNASLFYRKSPPGVVQWKRPRDICDNPQFFVEGISSHDLNQGRLGNCWFVAACSCLALKPHLWKKVIPEWKDQDWDPDNYAGIFHFCFWIFGEWVDVVVDDRLPTIDGDLLYCHSKPRNEFWSALLEKAYAKLSGCYESLDGGNTADAVVDFSGEVVEHVDVVESKYATNAVARAKLFEELLRVYNHDGLISCSIRASPHELEDRMACGLVKGHAYSVTAVKKMRLGHGMQAHFKAEKIFMIRMRNPWGKIEWNGAWSDNSEEWKKVGNTEKESMGLTVEDDGEFWMTFDDWCKYITDADVGHLLNTSMLSTEKMWHRSTFFSCWTKNPDPLQNRCGGCANHHQSFLQNPQYLFDVTKDEDEILVSLQQRDMKMHKPQGHGENLTIGFTILKVELNRKYRMHNLLTQEAVESSAYINSRTVFMRKTLPKGRYVIIPTTFRPEALGDFMLRIFTSSESGCRELTKDKPRVRCWSPFMGYPRAVTQVHVRGAEELERQDSSGGADPYVIISCEGNSVQSNVHKDTVDPVFDTRAIFYRCKPEKPITVEIWNSNALQDEFMGQVTMQARPADPKDLRKLQLQGQSGKEGEEMPGTVSLRIITSNELNDM